MRELALVIAERADRQAVALWHGQERPVSAPAFVGELKAHLVSLRVGQRREEPRRGIGHHGGGLRALWRCGVRLVLRAPDADMFRPGPAVEVVTAFEDTHFGTREMTVRDPDGRLWSVQAPAKE